VIERKRFHRLAHCSQVGRFCHRAIRVPLIHDHTFDKPKGRSAVAAGAMHECGLIAASRNRLERAIAYLGIGRASAELKVNEVDTGRFYSTRIGLNLGALFISQPKMKDRLETHRFEFADSRWCDGTSAGDGGLEASKVGYSRNRFFLNLRLSS